MKRLSLLPSILIIVGLLLSACQPVTAPLSETAQEIAKDSPPVSGREMDQTEDGFYRDPQGLYTVPVPTNWTVEESVAFTTLAGPDQDIRIHIVAIDDGEVESAIDSAWAAVDPDFDLLVEQTIDVPPSAAGDIDEFVVVAYQRADDDPIVQVEARRLGDKTYVLIFDATLTAAQQRTAQIQLVDTGFTINALEETDLAGVELLPVDDRMIDELEKYILEKMDQLDVPGAAVAIVQGGDLIYANGFGVRDLETKEPVTAETLMMIGSSTKSMTTMLMAQLVDDGIFTWDTPVVQVLPEFRVADAEVTERITMENLVCACTGVPRRDFEWIFNASELQAEDVVESLADFEFFTDFGEAFQYSNQMVATAGYLAALAAGGEYGQLYEDYLALFQERILDPMNMDQSTFSFEEVAASDNYATPYGVLPSGEMAELPLTTEAILIPMAPAGALWSNVLDMASYLNTELNDGMTPDGTQLVSAENLAATWEPQIDISADASYGLGWVVEDYEGVLVISHGGNTFGFTSELAFLPDADLGISILTNQQGSALNQIVRYRLLELLFEQEPKIDELLEFQLDLIAEAQGEFADSLVDEIDRESIEPYLGAYTHEALGDVMLEWEDDRLFLDVGELRTEIRASEDEEEEIRYITVTPPLTGLPVEFSQDEDGNPTITFGIGVVEYIFEQTG